MNKPNFPTAKPTDKPVVDPNQSIASAPIPAKTAAQNYVENLMACQPKTIGQTVIEGYQRKQAADKRLS